MQTEIHLDPASRFEVRVNSWPQDDRPWHVVRIVADDNEVALFATHAQVVELSRALSHCIYATAVARGEVVLPGDYFGAERDKAEKRDGRRTCSNCGEPVWPDECRNGEVWTHADPDKQRDAYSVFDNVCGLDDSKVVDTYASVNGFHSVSLSLEADAKAAS